MQQPQFVWDATFDHNAGEEAGIVTGMQLVSAISLRKALVKFEKFVESQGLKDVELKSLSVRPEMVI